MSLPTSTKSYIVQKKPVAEIEADTFKLETTQIEKPTGSNLLVQVQYLSNDPAQRTWIQKGADPERAYFPLPNEGDIMPARALGKVIAAGPNASKFKEGDFVSGGFGWTEYATCDESGVQNAVQIPGLSPSVALGALGSTGLTAYYGLLEVGKAVSDDKCIVVSGAAGATGSIVVQIAKKVLNVEKVIGLAGGKEKCDFVKSLGADECIDYKSSDWKDQLRSLTERKIGMVPVPLHSTCKLT